MGMKKGCVVVVSFGLLASLCMAPTAAADSRFHGRSAGMRLSGGHSLHAHKHLGHKHGHSLQKHGFGHHRLSPHHTHGHSFHKHGFGHHQFFRRHFVSVGVVAPSAVLFSSPPIFLGPPPYYSAPVYAPPVVYGAPVYSPPAPPPAVPRVVEYPTGRYELRGDGVS